MFSSRIRRTINNGIENVVMDLTNVEEVGEDTVELVGNFAEMIEELGNPFKLGFAAQEKIQICGKTWMVVKNLRFLSHLKMRRIR